MTDQATPAKVRLTDGLGPNARKLASQLQNAAYNCGYEDAHPSNATTRQAKADAKCRVRLTKIALTTTRCSVTVAFRFNEGPL